MRHLRERLSPALVLSIIAVILAIGGTAFALGKNTVGSRQIKNHSIKNADIKPKSIRGLFIAYANVNQNGTVDSSHSKGIASANITNPSGGTYCISGLGFTPKGAQVTLRFNGAYDRSSEIVVGSTGFCPSAKGVEVITTNTTSASPTNWPFFVGIYK
jgi:hypothetical protein